MATASRDSQALNALYTSTVEKWMGAGRVEDTVFTANQLIWLMSRAAKEVGTYGFNLIQPLMTTKNTGVGWFEYDDSLSIDSMPGPESAKFDMAFLGGPLVITEQEEIENAEEHRRVNMLQFKFDQLMLSMSEEINTAGFRGSGSNSKSIDGLEDIFFAGNPSGGSYPAETRAQAAGGVDNTYGGITRTGSTGWENYALNGSGTGYTSLSGNDYKALERLYLYASRGAFRPDIIVSSLKPYLDIHQLMANEATYERNIDTFRGINLGHDNLKFRSAVWLYDESATIFGDAGGDAAVGEEVTYVLNSMFLKMCVEQGYDFGLTDFDTPVDGRISIGHLLWRGQILSTNPRYGAVHHGLS